MPVSVLDRELAKIPYAVIDLETTGLSTVHDRVVELAVVVVLPGEAPRLVFETLVNPRRAMGATEIHGLTSADVQQAPDFAAVAEPLVAALSNRVVVAHNAEFDMAILGRELDRWGWSAYFPYLCTMLLPRTMNREFRRLSLAAACTHYGVELGARHTAAADAMAAAEILRRVLVQLRRQGLRTFDELRAAAPPPDDPQALRFVHSLRLPLLTAPPAIHRGQNLRPRTPHRSRRRKSGVARYFEAVLDVVADLRVEAHELEHIEALVCELALSPAEIRAVHVKIYSGMLSRFVEDARIDPHEAGLLHRLHTLLSRLGWAPGEPVPPG